MPKKSTGRWPSVAVRLAERTIKTDTCWPWIGSAGKYGRIMVDGRIRGVHVIALELASGQPIPEGFVVAHTCDRPLCVRNDDVGVYIVRGIKYPRWGHLFLCPNAVNQFDKVSKARQARGAAHGRRKHPELSRGERNPRAKLTEAMVREIRQIYAIGGIRQVDLARRFGVNQTVISQIVRGGIWRHVSPPTRHGS
jgi:hypothetical protein